MKFRFILLFLSLTCFTHFFAQQGFPWELLQLIRLHGEKKEPKAIGINLIAKYKGAMLRQPISDIDHQKKPSQRMGIKFLWDTNTAIYYLQRQFPPSTEQFIDSILQDHQPSISAITEIELLCWKTASENDLTILKNSI